jgi:hypothetical protein
MLAGDVSRDAAKFITKEAKESLNVGLFSSSATSCISTSFRQGVESVNQEQFIHAARKVFSPLLSHPCHRHVLICTAYCALSTEITKFLSRPICRASVQSCSGFIPDVRSQRRGENDVFCKTCTHVRHLMFCAILCVLTPVVGTKCVASLLL